MTHIIKRNTLFRFLAIMLMITTFLPLITNNLPPIVRSHHLWTPIWFFSLVLFAPKTFTNKVFLYSLIVGSVFAFFLLDIVWPYTDEWNRRLIYNEFYIFSVGLSLYAYFWTYKDGEGIAFVIKWTLIFITITAIMSIVSSFIDPLYARKLTGGEITRDAAITNWGGGSYGYGQALVLLIPILVYFYRNIKWRKSKLLVATFIVIYFFTLLRMQFFANILLAAILLGIAITSAKNIRRTSLIVVSIVVVTLLVPNYVYADLLRSISSFFSPESNVYQKFNGVAIYLEASGNVGPSNPVATRGSRFPMLMDAFISNPSLGHFSVEKNITMTEVYHLYWMNKLGMFGLLGFIPLVSIFIFYLKQTINYFDEKFTNYFLISIGGLILLGLMKNLSGREFWYMVFFVLPGMYFLKQVYFK